MADTRRDNAIALTRAMVIDDREPLNEALAAAYDLGRAHACNDAGPVDYGAVLAPFFRWGHGPLPQPPEKISEN